MKKPAILYATILAGASFLASCDADCVTGSGRQITQSRSVEPFSRVDVSGSMQIIYRQDSVTSLKITADDNILERIHTRTKGSTLEFDLDGNFCDQGPIRVYISSPEFRGIEASGAVEFRSDGKINATDVEIDLSGASDVMLDLNAAAVKTHSSGASKISLVGQARSHDVNLNGAGELDAYNFAVSDYRVKSSGASELHINVLNNLNVQNSGASNVRYRGKPANVQNSSSGASSLKAVQ